MHCGLLLPRVVRYPYAGGVPSRLLVRQRPGGGHHKPLRGWHVFAGRLQLHGGVQSMQRGRVLPHQRHERSEGVPRGHLLWGHGRDIRRQLRRVHGG
jgi:hypothetical protein